MITLTPDEVYQLAVSYLQALYPTRAVTPNSYLGHQAEALSQLVDLLQQEVADAQRDGIPAYDAGDGVLKSRCSSDALDEWAYTFGLPSNRGAGLFGRNGAQAATGGGAPVLGTPGTVVPAGSTLTDPTGKIVVQLASGVTVGAGGSVAGSFSAVTAGASGNLPAGTDLYWSSPPAGLAAKVTLTTALSTGYDEEGDLALLARLVARLQTPITGGTASDFRTWAQEATDSTGAWLGITRAYVYKKRNGLGSVDVVITTGGSGKGRDPDNTAHTPTIRSQVQAYLDAKRVVCDTVRVVSPYFPAGQRLTLALKVLPRPGYGFDFSSAPLAVTTGSTTTVVKLTTSAATAALSAAVTAGKKPRVQFLLPALSPIPYQARATSAADSMGVTTVTLDAALPAAPLSGDTCYPGGGAVVPVALAVLQYIDTVVGPSNQSGTADRLTDSWEDQVYVSSVARAMLDAVDDAGLLVVDSSPRVGTGDGVQVTIGAGTPSAADVPLYDNVPSQGPQLPEVYSIRVLAA